MANGRAAAVEAHDALAQEPFLAIGEIAGRAASARILLAAPLSLDEIERSPARRSRPWTTGLRPRLRVPAGAPPPPARRARLAEQTLAVAADEAAALALARGVLSLGLARLPWTARLKQWRDRVMFLRRAEGEAWADLSDEALAATPAGSRRSSWAKPGSTRSAPTTSPRRSARRFRGIWRDASTTKRRPISARRPGLAPIDYKAEGGPAIALRVQELFGLKEHPSLAGGRIPLTLELLSPAHRPIQITRDLPGFWRGSWAAVRADLRGRYPRHFWPEDPAAAAPTARAKPRGT